MSTSFTFTLQPEKQASYSRIELLVVLLHLITFCILAVSHNGISTALLVGGMATALIYLALFFLRKTNQPGLAYPEIPVYLLAVWWFFANVYWMGCLVFIFGLFATVYRQKVQVIVSAGNILYRSFPKRVFQWEQLNNVILKDGMLTIDFKNNKLIQQLVQETGINEAVFNSFCRIQLQAAGNKEQTL